MFYNEKDFFLNYILTISTGAFCWHVSLHYLTLIFQIIRINKTFYSNLFYFNTNWIDVRI